MIWLFVPLTVFPSLFSLLIGSILYSFRLFAHKSFFQNFPIFSTMLQNLYIIMYSKHVVIKRSFRHPDSMLEMSHYS